jgi:2-(1,2-epoxy-1,2-dihydrophenyl)acetyl-CoA isomerase
MSLYPHLPEILVTRDSQDPRIAIVSLNRPPQRNAFTGEMKDSLVEAFGRLDRDDSVKVVVLKGEENPGRAFCAG